jgi:hypothetical protein
MCHFPKGVGDMYTPLSDAEAMVRLQQIGAVQDSPLSWYVLLGVPVTPAQTVLCYQQGMGETSPAAKVFQFFDGMWLLDRDMYLRDDAGIRIVLCADEQTLEQKAALGDVLQQLRQTLS